MTQDRQQSENVTVESLEQGLINLPKLSVPTTLRARLFKGIPDTAYSSPAGRSGTSLRRTWAGAAAVIFVCGLAFVINYGSSILPSRLITEVNVVDHNSTNTMDTNHASLVNK